MQQAMRTLMTEARGLTYEGENGATFKTDVSQIASDFVKTMSHQLAAITAAVNRATTSIAGSLGGTPPQVQLAALSLAPEAVTAAADLYDIDTDQLGTFRASLTRQIDVIRDGLQRQRTALAETDWHGNAKNMAVAQVTAATTRAISACTTSQTALQQRIDQQVESSLAADGSFSL